MYGRVPLSVFPLEQPPLPAEAEGGKEGAVVAGVGRDGDEDRELHLRQPPRHVVDRGLTKLNSFDELVLSGHLHTTTQTILIINPLQLLLRPSLQCNSTDKEVFIGKFRL